MHPVIAPVVMVVMGVGCLIFASREKDTFMRRALLAGAGVNGVALLLALNNGF